MIVSCCSAHGVTGGSARPSLVNILYCLKVVPMISTPYRNAPTEQIANHVGMIYYSIMDDMNMNGRAFTTFNGPAIPYVTVDY